MPKFAANLTYLFNEMPFLDRFAAAARAGFKGVEFLYPYEHPASEVAARLRDNGLVPVLFNVRPGAQGERGLAALPGREREFWTCFEEALDYARVTGAPRIHVLAGLMPEGATRAAAEETYVQNLRRAADRAAPAGVTLLIEPLNARDNPGYFLRTTGEAVAVLDKVARDNLRLQLDLYHCQISEGDLARHIEGLLGRYAHVQIANPPDRHEPDRGEINYPFLFDLLDRLGYGGWVGCEYRPASGTLAGLGWAKRWGISG